MKVIVCFGETRILVPCDAAEEMTVKDLTEKAVARYKKVMNKSHDEEFKVSYLKTQSEGAMVDADDRIVDIAEDKDIFTAVCEEPLPQLINTSNGQVVLAVISNDGGQTSDSIVHTMQLNQAGSLSPFVSSAVGLLQQSMSQQSTTCAVPNTDHPLEDDNLGVDDPPDSDDKDSKNEFKCDQCPKKFKQSWKLRQHLIAHARRDEMKKYECDKCAASFCSEWLLQRHAKIHNGTSKPRFCLVCNRAFRGSTDLKVHMRVHTGEKPFKCETCPKAFGDRSALRRHNMTHTGLKPRACPHCPLAFRQTAPLIQHLRLKHNINIRHRCSVCYMSFCEDDAYIIHMASIHHKSVTITESKKEDSAEQDVTSELAMGHGELQSAHEMDGDEATDEGNQLVESEGENGIKNEVEESTVHLVQQSAEDEGNKEDENDPHHNISQTEQVVAERSIQEAYMNETVSSEAEQGEAITINQETQDLVLPADLVVAHQLIAVQQSSMDVQ